MIDIWAARERVSNPISVGIYEPARKVGAVMAARERTAFIHLISHHVGIKTIQGLFNIFSHYITVINFNFKYKLSQSMLTI